MKGLTIKFQVLISLKGVEKTLKNKFRQRFHALKSEKLEKQKHKSSVTFKNETFKLTF